MRRSSKPKGGYREDLGFSVRSGWEANFARYLHWLCCQGEIVSWDYEPCEFWFEGIKRGCRSYKPDFKVEEKDGTIVYYEVKGWLDPESKTKLRRMTKYHPDVKVILVDGAAYKGLQHSVGKLIPGWE
jgi:hypothetical protein